MDRGGGERVERGSRSLRPKGDCEGLQPSSKGARVRFSGSKRTVIDGPFTETKELVAGFWLIQVKSKSEAISYPSVSMPGRWISEGGLEWLQQAGRRGQVG